MRLQGKTAIITAAASGMGRAGCEIFAREGASIFAVDIDSKRLDDVVADLRRRGAKAFGYIADLFDPAACRQCVEEGVQKLGGLDILWNNAGMPGPRNIEQLELDQYAKTMDLNVRSGLLASLAAVPHMRARGAGSIIFTASMAGLVASGGSPVYSAAKFAIVGLAKSLAVRYASDKIRVNAICPGPIDTPMLPTFFAQGTSPAQAQEILKKIVDAVPMGRTGSPEEVAHGALYLASDESAFVTGIALPIDGGFTAA